MDINSEAILQKVYEVLAEYGLKILAAIAILIIGRYVAKLLSKLVSKGMERAGIENTLVSFTEHLLYIAALAFVVITTLATLGLQTTSLVAAIGAAGLAVGFALQGSLANLAAGVMLIIFKPFKVGDFVELAGKKGTVKAIQIFNTILNSPDNIRVIMPNAQVTGSHIMNFTSNGTRRVDLVIGVSYEDDLKKTHQVIERVLADDERVLKDPAPTVAVSELGDSSVNFVVRPWVKAADYWNVYFDITEKVKLALDQNGITIPFPQHDIHIKNETVQNSA